MGLRAHSHMFCVPLIIIIMEIFKRPTYKSMKVIPVQKKTFFFFPPPLLHGTIQPQLHMYRFGAVMNQEVSFIDSFFFSCLCCAVTGFMLTCLSSAVCAVL